jgi:hypothetical protein
MTRAFHEDAVVLLSSGARFLPSHASGDRQRRPAIPLEGDAQTHEARKTVPPPIGVVRPLSGRQSR